jgi:hypothetical protein
MSEIIVFSEPTEVSIEKLSKVLFKEGLTGGKIFCVYAS